MTAVMAGPARLVPAFAACRLTVHVVRPRGMAHTPRSHCAAVLDWPAIHSRERFRALSAQGLLLTLRPRPHPCPAIHPR